MTPPDVSRLLRGGPWYFLSWISFRSAYRDHSLPGHHSDCIGFRVVCLHATPQDFTWLA